MSALRLRKELAALIRSRAENGKPAPPAAGLASLLARLAVVLERGGPNVPAVQRMARALGAGELPAAMVLPEVRRAASESRLGRDWRLPTPDILGLTLGVSEAERGRLGLSLIGAADMPAADRRRARDRKRKALERRADGVEPRKSPSHPWIDLGISRATYFRRKNKEMAMPNMSDRPPENHLGETPSSARLIKNNRDVDFGVSIPTSANVEAARQAPPPERRARPFEAAPAAPPIRAGSIRDRAIRSVIRPHARILQAVKTASGPIEISDIARRADMRHGAARRAVEEMAAAGLVHRQGRDEVVLSASIAALSSAAASPNEYR